MNPQITAANSVFVFNFIVFFCLVLVSFFTIAAKDYRFVKLLHWHPDQSSAGLICGKIGRI